MFGKVIDKKEYVIFITEYKTAMYRIAYGYLCDETKSLDAVDEAVYLGYKHLKQLKEAKYLKTWFTRILINECYRIIRNNKREIAVDVLPNETYYDDSELNLPLKIAVQKLQEDLRKVIVLRYFGGYTISETAEILEIPEGTVATRARKALGLLRLEFSD